MEIEAQNNRWKALAGTLLFHGLLFLLFFLIAFKTPIPPYPESGGPGLEVNFGTSDDGIGTVQPDEIVKNSANNSAEENVSNKIVKVSNPVKASAPNILAQENEDAPSVEKVKETKAVSEVKKEEPKEEKPKVNAAALYKGKHETGSNAAKGEGETNKPGDQGNPNGSKDSKYHGPGGGNGNAPGNGTDGPGGDNKGPIYKLTNRKAQNLPVPKSNFQEEGKVVVEITVDKNGNVIKAKPGVKGSTTADANLLSIAKKAALSAKFNASADSPEEQKGTIIYNFILK